MNITEIKYRQIKNLGNYESAQLEAIAEVDGDVNTCVDQLRQYVRFKLNQEANDAKLEKEGEDSAWGKAYLKAKEEILAQEWLNIT